MPLLTVIILQYRPDFAALRRTLGDGETDPHRLSQVIRRTIGKWVSDTYRRRPMIIPTVLEV